MNLPLGKTTSFCGVNAILLIGEIGREKEKQLLLKDTTTVESSFYR
jgi:hypothetical protein